MHSVTAQPTPTAAAGSPRRGRPRRQVGLSAPALQPLLDGEHTAAVAALSSLLAATEVAVAGPSAGVAAPTPAAGTAAILDALSRPGARMPSAPTTRERPAA